MSDLIGYGSVGIVKKFSNVKNGLYFALTIDAIGGIAYIYLSHNLHLVPYLIAICRVGMTMTFNLGYVSIKDLFPTKFTANVYAKVNLYAHLFSCFSPLAAEIPYPLPFIIYLFVVAVAFLATSYLEEYKENEHDSDSETELSPEFVL